MSEPRITIVMPCFLRPYRTQLAIDCIKNQTVQHFEAFVIGDGCPVFRPVIDDPRFISFNCSSNNGGYGYVQVNYAIHSALGKYFVFMGNDDSIDPDHFDTYLRAIENTSLDFAVFPNVTHKGRPKKFKLKSWKIGHCALIVRTDFLKMMPPHKGEYNHDWELIENMLAANGTFSIIRDNKPTYHMDPYKFRGTTLDDDDQTRRPDSLRFHSRVAKGIKRILVALKLYK